ncbi:MAG: DNA cytosine methyltransferase [Ruminococcaceae bacterium]|nr:DNA cytosine methyltransferase [Oscillospiraceae bacterium]
MRELIVDNFAGGGGASTGIEMAVGRSVDIAINHGPDAIKMHRANHPNTRHYCEDVWQVDPVEACGGQPVGLAWFSPDCTHFSRAKGGKPVDKNIRGLAWVAIRWAALVRPRVIMLENVPEIRTWGPLGEDGKPIKARSGETFEGFMLALTTGIPKEHPAFAEMCEALRIAPESELAGRISAGLGYDAEYRILRSCDYGAPTTRTRFYLVARCDGKPVVFPEPTHGEGLIPYRTAAECIDWSIPAKSIFERDKPLAENTLRRIARGIKKFVIDNPEPFIVGETVPSLIQYHSETAADDVRGQELSEPLMTVDTNPRYALSVAHIMKNYAGGYTGAGSAADKPLDTVTDVDHNSLVTAHILTLRNNMDGQSVDEPLTTISTSGAHHAEVQAFLLKYFSTGTAKPVGEPLDTVTTKDRFALVTIHGEEYIITDIRMRMLQPRELFNAQGFPENYIIDRDDEGAEYPKTKQVARCGNAVTPPVPAALVRANLPEMCNNMTKENHNG